MNEPFTTLNAIAQTIGLGSVVSTAMDTAMGRPLTPDTPPQATGASPDRTEKPRAPQLPMAVMNALRTGGDVGATQLDAIWADAPFDVTIRDQKDHTLLHLALSLLPQQRPADQAPEAVYPTVAWLLAHGAPVDAQSTFGVTVLDQAKGMERDYPGTVTALRVALEQRVLSREINAHDGTPTAPRIRL